MAPTGDRSVAALVKACLWGLALTLGLSAPAMANEHTKAAIAQFESTTLPSLQAMAPFIEKSTAERIAAFDDLTARRAACNTASSEAYDAKERLIYAAAYDCQVMTYWLADNETGACRYLIWTDEGYAKPWSNSSKAEKAYETAGIREMHARLVAAMGCDKRSREYWAQKTVDAFRALAADYFNNAAKWEALDSNASYAILDPCLDAKTLAGDVSTIAEAAQNGCYVLRAKASKNDDQACEKIQYGVNALIKTTSDDPLAAEWVSLNLTFLSFSNGVGCNTDFHDLFSRTAPPAPMVVEPEVPAPTTNAVPPEVRQIREFAEQGQGYQAQAVGSMDLAEQWQDRDSAYVCHYYQEAVSYLRKADHAYYQAIQLIESHGYDTSSDNFAQWKATLNDQIKTNDKQVEGLSQIAAPYCETAGKEFY